MALERRFLIVFSVIAILLSSCSCVEVYRESEQAEVKYVEGPLLHPPNPNVYDGPPFEQGPSPIVSLGTRSNPIERVVAVLIEFTNVGHMGNHDVNYFDDLLFSTSSGSMYHYYREASYNQFSIFGDVGPSWYTSSETMEQYGRDSSGGVDDFYGPIYRLVVEAVQLADASVDFSQYDQDNDGVVDNLVVIHAGDSQESSINTNNIWSHSWAVVDADPDSPGTQNLVTNDGVQVYKYIMLAENSPLGVFAHEFGHALGLPDLYDTDDSSKGIGKWGVMGGGSWLGIPDGSDPSLPCAFSKIQLGWVVPYDVNEPRIGVEIPSVRSNPLIFKLPIRDSNGEYFLVENRQKEGYDSSLPGSGLLIWHVDENVPDNSNDAHRMVDLEEADEKESGDRPEDPTDPWSDNKNGFHPTSEPNSNAYGNERTGWRVKSISPSGTIMTADLSKQVLDDISVVSVQVESFVDSGDSADIVINISNNGARDQQNVPLNFTIYHQDYGDENVVITNEVTVSELKTGEYTRLTFVFYPSTTGKFIVEAIGILADDEIPENNDRIAHFNCNVLYFWDDAESGNLSWTTNTSLDRFRWDMIDEYPVGSYSPTHSWHFGLYNGSLSPVNKTEFTLTSADIYIPPGSDAHIVMHHKYIFEKEFELGGRRPPDRISDVGHLEVYNGTDWTEIKQWGEASDGTIQINWLMWSYNITNYLQSGGTTIKLRFRVTSDGRPVGEGWWLDNIGVVKEEPQHGLVFKVYDRVKTVEAGSIATFLFKIINVGDYEDKIGITALTVPQGWDYIFTENASRSGSHDLTMPLMIDESALIYLKVQTPASAKKGSNTNVTAVAVSVSDDTISQQQNVTVHIATSLFDITLGEFLLLMLMLFILVIPIAFVVNHLRKTRKVYR